MGNREVEPESIPLAVLLRYVGQPANFKIIKQLTKGRATPTELAEILNCPRTNITSQLLILRKLGLVDYQQDGLYHQYFILRSLPTLQHELIVDLVKLDDSDPEQDPLKDDEEADLPVLDKETRDKIKQKQSERFRKKLSLLASYWGHPGLTSAGQRQEKIRSEIKEIDREIHQLQFP